MNRSGRLTATGLALVLGALAVTEGTRFFPYRDIAGVTTYCTGLTDPDDLKSRYTTAECEDLDRKNVMAHDAGISQCIRVDVDPGRWQAYVHFAFNVGVHSFCRSRLAKRINAGEAAPCDEILRWKYVAGKDCFDPKNRCGGIESRRRFEHRWCVFAERPPFGLLN